VKPTIGFCLSGGGARGLVQIGVFKAFEEEKIYADYVAGTSIGSLMGGYYVSDYPIAYLDNFVKNNKNNLSGFFFPDKRGNRYYYFQKELVDKYIVSFRFNTKGLQKFRGISYGQNLIDLLLKFTIQQNLAAKKDFNNLPRKFRIVGTDLINGRKKVFKRGFLFDAIASSVSVPSLLFPYKIGNSLYVDGGILDNIPVDVLLEFKPDIIITVDNSSPLRTEDRINTFFDIFDQITTITSLSINKKHLEMSDVIIKPSIDSFFSTDFMKAEALIDSGYTAAKRKIDKIKNLILDKIEIEDKNFFIQHITYDHPIIKEFLYDYHVPGYVNTKKLYYKLLLLFETGYFDDIYAKISRDTLYFISKNAVEIDSIIIENDLFLHDKIRERLRKLINNKIYYFSFNSIKALIRDINFFLFENGYNFSYVKDYVKDRGNIIIILQNYKIKDINLSGLKLIKDNLIYKKLSFKKDDIINYKDISKSINNIYSTNHFNRITYRIEEIDSNFVNLYLNFEEKPMGVINFGYQYNHLEKALGYFQIGYDVTPILNNSIYLTTIFGNRNLISLSIQNDEMFSSDLGFQIKGTYENKKGLFKNHFYRQESRRYSISFTGNYLKKIGFSLFSFNYRSIYNYKDISLPFKKENFSYFEFANFFDTRNHLIYPEKGIYIKWLFRFSDNYFFQNKNFYQFEFINQFNLKIDENIVYELYYTSGYSKHEIPYDLKFAINEDVNFPLYDLDEFKTNGKFIISNKLRLTLNNYSSDILRKNLYLLLGYSVYSPIDNFKEIFIKKRNKKFVFFISLIQTTFLGDIKFTYGFNSKRKNIKFFIGTKF